MAARIASPAHPHGGAEPRHASSPGGPVETRLPWYAEININEWTRALSEIEALDFDKALFSHEGNAGYYGSKNDVIENREFIQDLQAAIVAEFKKGTHFAKVPEVVKLPKYENWAMYNEWLAMNVWRVMLDMHMGPFPWRPSLDFEN